MSRTPRLTMVLDGMRLMLAGDDGTAYLQSEVPTENSTGLAFTTALKGNLLLDYVKLLKSKQLTLGLSGQAILTRHEDGEAAFPIDPTARPLREFCSSGTTLHLTNEGLVSLITPTTFAAGTRWHKYISGTLIESKDDQVNVVASDGALMAVAQLPHASAPARMIVPVATLQLLGRFARDGGLVTITETPLAFTGTCGPRIFSTGKTEGHFPDYRRVVPEPTDEWYRLDMNREIALDTARLVAQGAKDAPLELSFRQDELELICGDTKASLAASSRGGISLKVSANYLLQILANCPGERVELHAKTPTFPLLIQSMGSQKAKYVVVPLSR